MVSPRAYRSRLSVEPALAELRRSAGTQFDPMVVEGVCDVAESYDVTEITSEARDHGARSGAGRARAAAPR